MQKKIVLRQLVMKNINLVQRVLFFWKKRIPFVIFPSVSMVILFLKEDYEVFLDLYFPNKKKMESEN